MYKYTEFNTEINLGYIIICLYHLYITKHNPWSLLLNETRIFLLKNLMDFNKNITTNHTVKVNLLLP